MNSNSVKSEISVGELIDELKLFSPSHKIYFGGLTFYRLKFRNPDTVQMEFNQTVYPDKDGKVVIEN